jgi:hypothetical protein
MTANTTFSKDTTSGMYHPASLGASVPFLIQPGNNQYAFYNSLKNLSINQNDYLLNDLAPVTKEVNRTNA